MIVVSILISIGVYIGMGFFFRGKKRDTTALILLCVFCGPIAALIYYMVTVEETQRSSSSFLYLVLIVFR